MSKVSVVGMLFIAIGTASLVAALALETLWVRALCLGYLIGVVAAYTYGSWVGKQAADDPQGAEDG